MYARLAYLASTTRNKRHSMSISSCVCVSKYRINCKMKETEKKKRFEIMEIIKLLSVAWLLSIFFALLCFAKCCDVFVSTLSAYQFPFCVCLCLWFCVWHDFHIVSMFADIDWKRKCYNMSKIKTDASS